MSYGDTRRAWRRRANDRGFTVRGLNGEVRKGLIVGNTRGTTAVDSYHFAKIFVADEFAPIMFPIKWEMVKAIADGHVSEIPIRANTHLQECLRALDEAPVQGFEPQPSGPEPDVLPD